ncbi:MAG TPA: hypothetical protein VM784_11740 [Actinomycetota bacterium]|nr:hypothetical protein [Actinomycetota bacterium]
MEAGVTVVLEPHRADVDGITQHVDDSARGERHSGVSRKPFGVEQLRDRLRAELIFNVEIEDAPHDGRLRVVGQEQFRVPVTHVAVGDLAHDPAPFRRGPVHARDDALDDGGALELGEYPEHLHHHLARGRGRVEGLGGRAQRHPGTL